MLFTITVVGLLLALMITRRQLAVVTRQLTSFGNEMRYLTIDEADDIPLNIAEGKGKRSVKDRTRFFDIARGSALECAVLQDVLVVCGGSDAAMGGPLKTKLKRIVAMLTRLAMRSDRVAESAESCNPRVDYEHRFAEHE